jgi:hypothetical protein
MRPMAQVAGVERVCERALTGEGLSFAGKPYRPRKCLAVPDHSSG